MTKIESKIKIRIKRNMNYLQRRYNQVCIIVNYMIKLRCSVNSNLFENGAKRDRASVWEKNIVSKNIIIWGQWYKKKTAKGIVWKNLRKIRLGIISLS